MRSSWLYLAMRSVRLAEPVLIWPALVATAMSAMVVSSVSPLRWLMIVVKPLRRASSMASSVSVSVPIWFTLMRMLLAAPLVDAVLQPLGVGHEQVVADQLHLAAQLARQLLPAGPVVLGQAVLDGADRPALAQSFFHRSIISSRAGDVVGLALEEAVAGLALLLGLVEQLRRRRVEGEDDLLAELVAGLLDGLGQHLEGLVAALEVRSEAALVADGGAEVAVVQHLLEVVEDLGAHAQGFAEGRRRRAA